MSVAIIGGGVWCRSVIRQLRAAHFAGAVWPVHPKGGRIEGFDTYARLKDLPAAPDASFVGVNRDATIDVIGQLSRMGAGGAVCFASGFAEVADGHDRHQTLLRAAGQMPILGPNCYGYINALDGAMLWPDQHGCRPAQTGVAILTQSSNIAINLTMHRRALPMAYVVTCGNQAQVRQSEIALALLEDPRVTAIGLHIEGFGDIAGWQDFARRAAERAIRVVAIKVGRSGQAQAAAVSHTASLTGQDAAAQALLDRFGFARVHDLSTLLESLTILHYGGGLPSGRIAAIACSGGEAALSADLALGTDLTFPALREAQRSGLSRILGSRVTLANPLDYHTYIWGNAAIMTDAFSAMVDPGLDLTILIVDLPRSDLCDPSAWDCVLEAALATRARTGGRIAVCATLPELLPEDVALRLARGGVIPLLGLRSGLAAAAAAILRSPRDLTLALCPTAIATQGRTLSEAESKRLLAKAGLAVPASIDTQDATDPRLDGLRFPVVLKGAGHAHKTEHDAVALDLPDIAAVRAAAARIPPPYLVEEMVPETLAELLVGVTLDPAHGYLMTIGAGGTLTELWDDTAHLMLPASRDSLRDALTRLRITPLLQGYRGRPAADLEGAMDAIDAIQRFALAHAPALQEVEINPLICTRTTAVAVDALIRIAND